MKKAGIILIILQIVALFGSSVNGKLATLFQFNSVPAIAELIGFFLPTIIGVILIIKAGKKNAGKKESDQ